MKSLVYIFGIILSVITIQSCSLRGTEGNGVIVTKDVDISNYEELSVAGQSILVYTQRLDTTPYLQIEVDENIYPLLEIKSENNKLSIYPAKDNNINPTKLIIRTNSKELKNLSVAGSIEVQLKDTLRSTSLTMDLAGKCSVIANESIEYDKILIKGAGASNITLRGIAGDVNCSVAGSSNIDILELQAENVSCQIAGSGDIKTYAKNTLDIDIAGRGKIEYKGSPTVSQKIAGSGKVVKID